MIPIAEQVRENLREKGYHCSLINARFAKPFDRDAVLDACKSHRLIVTMEEGIRTGGYGEQVLDFLNENHLTTEFLNISIPDQFVTHGSVSVLRKEIGIDADSVTERIQKKLSLI
jgi:1-deoxy-D-xylulose-5-phosphate synthase